MLNIDIAESLKRASVFLADPQIVPPVEIKVPEILGYTSEPDELVKRVTPYYESTYHFQNKYPTESEVLKRYSITPRQLREVLVEVNLILHSKRFLPKIELDELPTTFEYEPEFMIAVDLISDPNDRKSLAAKLKVIGKSTQWWKNQLKDPRNKELFALRVNESWSGVAELAKLSLLKNVEAGDLPTIKYVDEKTGVSPSQQMNFDFIKVINQFMEILVHYLTPEQMEEVVTRFEATITIKELSA